MADYERRARQQQSVSNVWFIKKAVTRVHKIELCALHACIILYWARARHSFGRRRRRRRRNFRMQRKRHERTNERESPILLETNRPTDRFWYSIKYGLSLLLLLQLPQGIDHVRRRRKQKNTKQDMAAAAAAAANHLHQCQTERITILLKKIKKHTCIVYNRDQT